MGIVQDIDCEVEVIQVGGVIMVVIEEECLMDLEVEVEVVMEEIEVCRDFGYCYRIYYVYLLCNFVFGVVIIN